MNRSMQVERDISLQNLKPHHSPQFFPKSCPRFFWVGGKKCITPNTHAVEPTQSQTHVLRSLVKDQKSTRGENSLAIRSHPPYAFAKHTLLRARTACLLLRSASIEILFLQNLHHITASAAAPKHPASHPDSYFGSPLPQPRP